MSPGWGVARRVALQDLERSRDGIDRPRARDAVLPAGQALIGGEIGEDYTHDEALSASPQRPWCCPGSSAEVAAVLRLASELRVPVTARGRGTGRSGGCVPRQGGIVLSLERMSRIVEIDTANHAAVVEPGVTLDQLDAEIALHGLLYPVYPGETSASIGGNMATNAGGMRAMKYGVTSRPSDVSAGDRGFGVVRPTRSRLHVLDSEVAAFSKILPPDHNPFEELRVVLDPVVDPRSLVLESDQNSSRAAVARPSDCGSRAPGACCAAAARAA